MLKVRLLSMKLSVGSYLKHFPPVHAENPDAGHQEHVRARRGC